MHPLVKGKGAVWLHTGCGLYARSKVPDLFKKWKEVRLDADERVKPDIVASIVSMPQVKKASYDAVYSCHCLEHVYTHEVPKALLEFRRVVKADGFVIIQVPDLQSVGKLISEGRLYDTAYEVPGVDPIAPIDVLYGYRSSVASGNHFMAHKTGFTSQVLATALKMCGFKSVYTQVYRFNLYAIALPRKLTKPEIAAFQGVRIF